MRLSQACVAALSLCLFPLSGAFAQKTAKDYSVEDFFKRPQYRAMALSPNGERLAALTPHKGRDNLIVIDIPKGKRTVITGFDTLDVADFSWAGDDRLCLRVSEGADINERPSLRGSYCVDHDGNNLRDLTRLGQRGMTFLEEVPGEADKFVVSMAVRTRDYVDAYKLDTRTGRYDLLTFDSPGNVWRWIADRNGVVRVAVSEPERKSKDERRRRSIWHRDSAEGKWEKLWEFPVVGGLPFEDNFQPLAFDFDNTTLYVAHNQGRDKMAVFRYDTRAKKMGELVFEHPLIDVEGPLVFDHMRKKLVGIRYNAEMPAVKWFDPEMDRLQKMLDATLKTTVNTLLLPLRSDRRALVYSASGSDPGEYNLLDRTKPALQALVRTRAWLDPALMAERRFIKYRARDGLEIPAWLTIPRGSSGKNLPLIVNVHGGPNVRAYGGIAWGRPEAQFFASRGYAVLEPEPRASTGFGRKHLVSGFKQWGQAMQDDLNDGALYLVKEGIVDKSRMCIHGGSYGGYAAAMGVARDPDFWRCATPFVAVTDLALRQDATWSDTAQLSDYLETDVKILVGDKDADREMFMKYSPAKQAHRIKVPVFMAMGSADVRVPLAHGREFKNAMEAAGGKLEYVVYDNEGHGFTKAENVYDFYGRIEKFLAENLK